ncbi:MAG: hypothetical protein HWN65_21805, partial [Candidatus Helarchaeota archaeon]|nr:hypothetical protein [Candidatus Helarchaeota archaeon]
MILELLIFLGSLITSITASTLFFKYVTPKEKKELKSEREKLFKEVERHLKKENFLDVIGTFDRIADISEKLGELGISDEFRDRANNLRRKLGQEVKSDVSTSQVEIGIFIQQLLRGPYGIAEVVEVAQPMARPTVQPMAQPGVVEAPSRSLMEEGEEILARLKRLKGEAPAEEAAPSIIASAPPMPSPAAAIPPSMRPPVAAPPPPLAPPRTTPPLVPPRTPGPPMTSPVAAP